MGNYITFEIPNTETTWTHALVERSIEQSAGYSELTSQLITNNTFYDEEGISSSWYRIRFFDSEHTVYSAYTDPFQADGEVYCTAREVASFMGRPQFTDSTKPTRFEVEDLISDISDYIDEKTQHAWRKVRVTNEMHDVKIRDRYVSHRGYPYFYDYSTKIALYLKYRMIRPFIVGSTKIEVWDGSDWIDYIANYTEGRTQDYWINYERGIIYFVNRYPLWQRSNVRVTYDYGETYLDRDIKIAAIMLVAAHIVGGREDLNVVYPQSTMGTVLDTRDRYEKWTERAETKLEKHKIVLSTRYY